MKTFLIALIFFALAFSYVHSQNVNSGDAATLDPCLKYPGTSLNDCGMCTAGGSSGECTPSTCDSDSVYSTVMATKASNCEVICVWTGTSGGSVSYDAQIVCGNNIPEYFGDGSENNDGNNRMAGYNGASCTCGGSLTESTTVSTTSVLQTIVGRPYVYQGPYPTQTLQNVEAADDANGNRFNPSYNEFYISHVSYLYSKANTLREKFWSKQTTLADNWFFKYTGNGNPGDSWSENENGYRSWDGSDWTAVPKSDVHLAGTPPETFAYLGDYVVSAFMVLVPPGEDWVWIIDGFGFCISPGNCGSDQFHIKAAEDWQETAYIVKPEVIFAPSPPSVKLTYNIWQLKKPNGPTGCPASTGTQSCAFRGLSHFVLTGYCEPNDGGSGKGTISSSNFGPSESFSIGGNSNKNCDMADQYLDDDYVMKWEDPPEGEQATVSITKSCPGCAREDNIISLASSGIFFENDFTHYKFGEATSEGIVGGCTFVNSIAFYCDVCTEVPCNQEGYFRPPSVNGASSCDCVECDAATYEYLCAATPSTPYWDESTCGCVDCIEEHYYNGPINTCVDGVCYAPHPSGNLCKVDTCSFAAETCEYGRKTPCNEIDDRCCECETCDYNSQEWQEDLCPASLGDNPTHSWNPDCTCRPCGYTIDQLPAGTSADDPRLCKEDLCNPPPLCKPSCTSEWDEECGDSYYAGNCVCQPCSDKWGPDEQTYDQETFRNSAGQCQDGYYLEDGAGNCSPCVKCSTCPVGTQPVGYKSGTSEGDKKPFFIYID